MAAMQLITAKLKGGILPLTKETLDVPKVKHPAAEHLEPSALINSKMPPVNTIVFAILSSETVRASGSQQLPHGMELDHLKVLRTNGTSCALASVVL
jgi:hypothetical protein